MVGISRGRETAIRGLNPPAPEPEEDRPEPWVDPVKELDEPWENPFKDVQIGEPPLVPGPYTVTADDKTTPIYKTCWETEVDPRTGLRTVTIKTREGQVLNTVVEQYGGSFTYVTGGLMPRENLYSLKSY